MTATIRLLLGGAAALAAAVVLVPLAMAAGGNPASLPTLYVNYAMNCTFSIVDDSGNTVTSIPPGSYQVEVSTPIIFKLAQNSGAPSDFTGCKGWVQFQLDGPGVSLFTTLDSGCDSHYLMPVTSFPPNSTFTAEDLNQPSATRTTFTTLATGTPQTPPNAYGPGTGKGELSTDIVGSEVGKAAVSALTASLAANGRVALTAGGEPVKTLKAGRYRFRVADRSARAGFTIRPAKRGAKAKALTGAKFVGMRSATVRLTPGRWLYQATGGKAVRFVVTG